MKVVCIDKMNNEYITVGKSYTTFGENIRSSNKIYYQITNDKGSKETYLSLCFKPISEIRSDRLKDLGI